MEKYEVNKYLDKFSSKISDLRTAISYEDLLQQIAKLTEMTNQGGFWDDPNSAQKIFKDLNEKKSLIAEFDLINSKMSDLKELVNDFEDSEVQEMINEYINELDIQLDKFEIKTILSSPYDNSNCLLEIHPGAGGTESHDWAEMLYRMYLRFCANHKFNVNVIDYLEGEEAGIKSVTLEIKGPYAYGLLKSEKGVHRLVRLSPFDSANRRHTSFASVLVSPIFDAVNDVEVKDEDIKIDVFHSQGAGGQSVNTTDSAVRITHLKTKIVVTCQNERSQIKNREVAMNILKSKLKQLEIEHQKSLVDGLVGEISDINFGSQIRSYVFHPYSLVKDHRTDYETSQASQVLDGNLDDFINAYLHSLRRK